MNKPEILKHVKTFFPDLEIKAGKVRFYCGTPLHNVESILKEGLRGGDNLTGGNRGEWQKPILFCTPNEYVARKYGEVIIIEMTVKEFWNKNFDSFNDGLGDKTYALENKNWNKILIEAEYLSELETEEKGE